ncbi:hypothetical protein KBX71_16560 [Micromonospora sp. D93]|nr:hypothetical protein [Micromonospora sp. D93]MBQ1019466.1 hypothetical protein [Micromonospora sp. D93]
MFGAARRSAQARAGARFCDSCARVSTAAQRRYDQVRDTAYALVGVR